MTFPRLLLRFSLALFLGSTGACRRTPDDEVRRERRLGIIQYDDAPLVIHVPETVRVATPFDIVVRTYGGGCVAQGDTEVRVRGQTATIRPYDIFVTALPPGGGCTLELRTYVHHAVARFEQRGRAMVAMYGRVQRRAEPEDTTIIVERIIHVQ